MKNNREHSARPEAGEPPAPTEEQIQKAAYYLWLEQGRPEGCELDTWLAAKELLRHHHGRGGLHFPPSHEAQRSAHPFVTTPSSHP